MRPYHAGLLGADSLVVLDEAHLVPPFQKLLEAIADGGDVFGARAASGEPQRASIPSFRLISLSATGRGGAGNVLRLDREDLSNGLAFRRLNARKHLNLLPPVTEGDLATELVNEAWKLTDHGRRFLRIIVYADKREVARKAQTLLVAKAAGAAECGPIESLAAAGVVAQATSPHI